MAGEFGVEFWENPKGGGDNQYHAPHHQILCNLSAEMENKEQKEKKGQGTDLEKGKEIMAYE